MIKIGAVGLGRLGRLHAEHLAWKLPGARLAAICSISQVELDTHQTALENPATYLSYSQMLAHEPLDAVVLSSPSDLHCEQILAALEKGLHVFCEKPLGVELPECEQLVEALKNYPQQIFQLGFMRRYDPSYRQAKELIDAGKIGRPILFRGYSVDPESAIEGAIRYAGHSAGQFLDMAIHDIDLARWFLNSEPRSVWGIGGCYAHPEFGQYKDGDNVSALMQFENDAMAFFFAGRTAAHGYNIETEIIGTRGSLRIGSTPSNNLVEIFDAGGVRQEFAQDFVERFSTAFLNELQGFLDCIRTGRQPEVSACDGLEATRIAIAATASFQTNEKIDMVNFHASEPSVS